MRPPKRKLHKVKALAKERKLQRVRGEIEEYRIKAKAWARVKKAQIRMPTKPEYNEPRLPRDITKLSNRDIGNLMVQFGAWSSYAGGVLAQADVDRIMWTRIESVIRAKVMLSLIGGMGGSKLYEKKAEIELDDDVRKAARELSVAEATYKLTQAIANGYVTGKELCSREITRREKLEGQEPR